MAITFNGTAKLIILGAGTTVVSAQYIYSRWIDWLLSPGDNSKYEQAFTNVGGDPLPGGVFLGITYFLENGWKIRPQEADHALTINGNLYSRDGSAPLVPTVGAYNVVVSMSVSNLLNTVSTAGNQYTLGEIAKSVWDEPILGHTAAQTAGRIMQVGGSIFPETLLIGTPTTTTMQLAQGSSIDGFYDDTTVTILTGAMQGMPRVVTSYDGATRTITIDEPMPSAPVAGDTVLISNTHTHPTTQIAAAVWANPTGAQIAIRMAEAWGRLGLDPSKPLHTGQASITFGQIVMALTGDATNTTVTRQ